MVIESFEGFKVPAIQCMRSSSAQTASRLRVRSRNETRRNVDLLAAPIADARGDLRHLRWRVALAADCETICSEGEQLGVKSRASVEQKLYQAGTRQEARLRKVHHSVEARQPATYACGRHCSRSASALNLGRFVQEQRLSIHEFFRPMVTGCSRITQHGWRACLKASLCTWLASCQKPKSEDIDPLSPLPGDL
ncbi:hypothetical protein BDV96DRAFT_170003 [Lophiotrema nucula]|uniref:Uncharacterized protein n=1 Tax=Lophiotrema nucula TaxID=690887 RepID=A0A6A5Z1A2_9PLEO|nr:hypothetical protein BDV96DRAFT_170003 [Lophiotrema nucula]